MSQGRTRVALLGGGLVAAVVALVVLLGGCGGDEHPYQVRAIFDNATNVIPGEDVKIAGVKVGTVAEIAVQDNRRAALVLDIEAKGFQDFRQDASCIVSMQSLIGEKYVACTPTKPRRSGTPPPPLAKIPDGQPGAGQRLLPVKNTSSPVDPDLIANVMREPGPQRFRVILNELGTGLAGRGDDLREAVRRADPALKQTDEVLAMLAGQNQTLADLARDSDTALAPLARERGHLTSMIRSSGEAAQATASERAALAENLRRFPAFLRELIPTTDRLGALADAGTPLMTSLQAAAPGLNSFAVSLAPFAKALGPWFTSFGKTAEDGTQAIVQAKPAFDALAALADDAGPTLEQTGEFLGNLRYAGGIENFLDLIYNSANAMNGYDQFGHFLRGMLIVSACATYAITPTDGCNANFVNFDQATKRSSGGATAAGGDTGEDVPATAPRDAGLQRAVMVLGGATPAEALAKYPDPAPAATPPAGGGTEALAAGTKPAGSTDAALLNYLLAP